MLIRKNGWFWVACFTVTLVATRTPRGIAAELEILHQFLPFQGGSNPRSPLTFDGETLFGVGNGGTTDFGAVFAIDPDDSAFHVVHEFSGGLLGRFPIGEVIPVGSKLLGVTRYGGTDDLGAVFSINKDGSEFQILHSFAGGPDDGADPRAGLTLVDDTLYGTTFSGGEGQSGSVFSLSTDGSNYELLHSFGFVGNDGRYPAAPLTFDGTTLYGTTETGGSTVSFTGIGSVFAIDPDGDNYRTVYGMGTGGNKENDPRAPVTVVGSTIYGTTWSGGLGTGDDGAVFSVGTDGSEFQLLHSFSTSNATQGRLLPGSVTLVGSRLYSVAFSGTPEVQGTIFSLLTDGSDFRVEHAFAGLPDDGAWPLAGLTAVGSALYGTTQIGGEFNEGVIFRIVVPEPTSVAMAVVGLLACVGIKSRQGR